MKLNPEFEASEHSCERPAWKDFAQRIFEGGQKAEREKILKLLASNDRRMNDLGYAQALHDVEQYAREQ